MACGDIDDSHACTTQTIVQDHELEYPFHFLCSSDIATPEMFRILYESFPDPENQTCFEFNTVRT